jgi:hypothetical protein
MPPKPKLLLLDNGAIIWAFKTQVWALLCERFDVVVPSIIVRVEAVHWEDGDGRRHPIDLAEEIRAGRITEYEAPLAELKATSALLHPDLRSRIQDGEREALTYLRTHETKGVAFVTADGPAIEAAVALDVSEAAMSLESVLRCCGITKTLPERHRDSFVRRKLHDGGVRVVQGRARAV